MAMLFDIAILMVIYTGVSFLLPAAIQSDYSDIVKQIDKVSALGTAQSDVADTQKDVTAAQKDIDQSQQALDDATTTKATDSAQSKLDPAQSDLKSANSDLKDAQKDVKDSTKEVKDAGIKNPTTTAKASDAKEQDLRDSIGARSTDLDHDPGARPALPGAVDGPLRTHLRDAQPSPEGRARHR